MFIAADAALLAAAPDVVAVLLLYDLIKQIAYLFVDEN